MRGLISGICVAGALLLTAASMFMNWSFWTGQGGDASSSQVLGAVSIGIDVFKATLPLVIAWAWSARLRLGCIIGIMFFSGCLAFSLFSAIGFAASSRGAVTGSREAVSPALSGGRAGTAGDQGTDDIAWGNRVPVPSSRRPSPEPSRTGTGRVQTNARTRPWKRAVPSAGALATFASNLRQRSRVSAFRSAAASLKAEIDNLLGAGARNDQDQQAGLLARLTGFGVERVQTSIVVLFAVLVEFGSAFGLFLALLPMRGFPRLAPIAPDTATYNRDGDGLRCGRCAVTDRRGSRGPLTVD